MTFAHPTAFWLLLLLVPVALAHVRHRMALGRAQSRAVLAIRLAAMAALVVALAQPTLQRPDSRRTLVLVADVSASMTDADLARTQAEFAKHIDTADVRLVVFDDQAREVELTDGVPALRSLRRADAQPGSALADALALAGALVPQGAQGDVILCSDALATRGNARLEATRLGRRSIPVTTVSVSRKRSSEVVLRSVKAPPSARVGETVKLEAVIETSEPMNARIVVKVRTGRYVPRHGDIIEYAETEDEHELTTKLQAGGQTIVVNCPLTTPGTCRFDVTVEGETDTLAGNNAAATAMTVDAPLLVRVMESDDGEPATAALAKMLGVAADVKRVPTDAPLTDTDLLVLADVPATELPAGAQERIRDAVKNGMGLLATGGRRSFGPGGYADGALSEALPVRLPQRMERRDPSTTLVVIIDTSGSMGPSRVSLAKEVARLALARLKPHDRAGIVEFYGYKRWAAPIQPASNHVDLNRALNRMTPGGGTVLMPAIQEAYYGLLNVRTRTRHVLILTDAGVERASYGALLNKMTRENIHISTVLVGPRAGGQLLAKFAQMGRGRFYVASGRYNIPEIIFKQPDSSMLSPFVERPSTLSVPQTAPVALDVDLAKAPPITGYVETEIRPTADELLRSEAGDPVLAEWQFGLGKSAVWTSHISGEWTKDLAQWDGYSKLLAGLARRIARPSNELDVRAEVTPTGVTLHAAARAGAPVGAFEPAFVSVSSPEQLPPDANALAVDPCRPFRWLRTQGRMAPGTYLAIVSTENTSGATAFAIMPDREVTQLGPDELLLTDIQRIAADMSAERSTTHMPPTKSTELWPLLAALGLLLTLANVLARRWPRRVATSR